MPPPAASCRRRLPTACLPSARPPQHPSLSAQHPARRVQSVSMGKAKPAKHTSAELAAKAKAALQNAGGGKAGLADRKGGAAGHAKYKCHICGQQAPDPKTMQVQQWRGKGRAAAARPGRGSFGRRGGTRARSWAARRSPLAASTPIPTPARPSLYPPLQIHHEAKHPKLPYEPDKNVNMHELTGGVTVQVGVGCTGLPGWRVGGCAVAALLALLAVGCCLRGLPGRPIPAPSPLVQGVAVRGSKKK